MANVDDIQWYRDYEAVASYMPQGFSIQLRHGQFALPANGRGFTVPKHLFPTLLHEIAHLVQDRATFRGVIDFLDFWDQVSAVVDHVQRSGSNVPFPIVEPGGARCRLDSSVMFARELESLRRCREPRTSWTRGVEWTYHAHTIRLRQLRLGVHTINTPFVLVDFRSANTGAMYRHLVGAWEIKEAYSVAVGKLHGAKAKSRHVGYEYHAVTTIVEAYVGPLEPKQMIALCHWALQDMSPGPKLFELLSALRVRGPVPSWKVVYDFARQDAISAGLEQNLHDILGTLEQTENAHRRSGNVPVADLVRWYREHAQRLLDLQLDSRRRFPVDTFLCRDSRRMSTCTRNRTLTTFFREVEVPLLFLPNGELHTIASTESGVTAAQLNFCVLDLLNAMWRGKQNAWECPLYNSCKLALKNADCLTQPWLKSHVHPTCVYGSAGNILGLNNGTVLQFIPFPHLPFAP